jgi:hypothetical protein
VLDDRTAEFLDERGTSKVTSSNQKPARATRRSQLASTTAISAARITSTQSLLFELSGLMLFPVRDLREFVLAVSSLPA